MNKKQSCLLFYTYEYKELQRYFQSMVKQGWELTSMKISFIFAICEFKKCEPQKKYFFTDFSEYNGIRSKNTDKTEAYRSFIEEYGYTYITGARGVLVFSSDTPLPYEFRENTQENLKLLQKTTMKSIMNYIGALIVLFIVASFVKMRISTDMFSTNFGVIYTVLGILTAIVPVLFMLPPLVWVLCKFKKKNPNIKKFQRRAVLFNYLALVAVVSMVASNGGTIYEMLYVMMLSIVGVVIIGKAVYTRLKKGKGVCCISAVLLWIVAMFVYANYLQEQADKNDEVPVIVSKEQFYITSEFEPLMTYSESIAMSKEHVFYENGQYYDIMVVKDSIMKETAMDVMINESAVSSKRQVKDYTIYKRVFDYIILKDHIGLKLCEGSYEKMTVEDYDVIFHAIEESLQ